MSLLTAIISLCDSLYWQAEKIVIAADKYITDEEV